jgi:hypothetical protein
MVSRVHSLWLTMSTLLVCVGVALQAAAQQEISPSSLSLEQESLKNRFDRLEAVASRLAELAAASEPERAEQLRKTITASREQGIAEQFATIINLLEEEQVSAAARNQEQLHAQLEALLQVLLEDPGVGERNAMRKFLKEQLRDIGKIIRQQRSLHGETVEEGADLKQLGDDQERLTDETGKVQEKFDQLPGDAPPSSPSEESGESQQGGAPQGESRPPQGESTDPAQPPEQSADPMQRAAQRVEAARKAMREAEQELRNAQQDQAADKQRQAQRNLEAARAELERILRQLREEEMEQLLTRLAARFREMLAEQRSIYDETVAVHQAAAQGGDRTSLLKAIRLSRREGELVREAEKALVLLREDGTSVAFPETAEQIASDMQSLTSRLASGDVAAITQTIELDVITGLEDMIGAFDRARDDIAQQQGQGQPPGSGGSPEESPLVTQLAELRMIRTLQARIHRRTQVLGELVAPGEAIPADVERELETLAERQNKVFQATRDLQTQANR